MFYRLRNAVNRQLSRWPDPDPSAASLRCSVPALLKSAGHDGPLLYRGPCAAVRRGRQAAKRESTGMSTPFRQDRSPVEKPGPGSRTCRPWMGGKRQAGWPFSLVSFLFGHAKRK